MDFAGRLGTPNQADMPHAQLDRRLIPVPADSPRRVGGVLDTLTTMSPWRRYEFYEDRPAGSLERITLVDEQGSDAYLVKREPSRFSRLRRLSLHDRETNERARLRLKLFGPLSYELVSGGELKATIAKERLSARDRFRATSVDGGQLVATAPLGSGEYDFRRQGQQVARLSVRRLDRPPELRIAEATERFVVVALTVVIYLFEYHPGRT